MRTKQAYLDLIGALKLSIISFGEEIQHTTFSANKFIGDELLSFQQIEENVCRDKYAGNPILFAEELRMPFLRILSWNHHPRHASVRLRARELIDFINHKLFLSKPALPGIEICREALDYVYGQLGPLSDKFAFHPSKYAENRINGWPGAADLSLFSIQIKLESGEYRTIVEFADDLQRLGQTYLKNMRPGEPHNECAEFAQHIVDAATYIRNPPSSRSLIDHFDMMSESAASQPDEHRAPASKAAYRREWELSGDDFGSPVWTLMWHGAKPTDPYMLHIRNIAEEFEEWMKQVPLCAEMVSKTKGAGSEKEWLTRAKKVFQDCKQHVHTIASWNATARRCRLFRAMIDTITFKLNGQEESDAESAELGDFAKIMRSYRSPIMTFDEKNAMEYAWTAFLHFRQRDSMRAQQQSNSSLVQRLKETHGDTFAGKGNYHKLMYRGIQDAMMHHSKEFLHHWANMPSAEYALALKSFLEQPDAKPYDDEDDEDGPNLEQEAVAAIHADVLQVARDTHLQPTFRDLSKLLDTTDIVEAAVRAQLYPQIVLWWEGVSTDEIRKQVINVLLDEIYAGHHNRPSILHEFETEEQDIYCLNDVRVADPGLVKICTSNGRESMHTFSSQQIQQAAEIWRDFVKTLEASNDWQTKFKRELAAMRGQQLERNEKMAKVRLMDMSQRGLTPIKYAIAMFKENEKLDKLMRNVVVVCRREKGVRSEDELGLTTEEEMQELERGFDDLL